MTPISKKNLQNFTGGCDCPGFAVSVSVAFDSAAKTAVVQDNSTYGSGDGLASVNVVISDRHGNVKNARITVTGVGGKQTVSLAANMDLSEGINVRATVVTTNRCVADLSAYHVGPATTTVNLGNIDYDGDVDGGYNAPA